MCDASASNIRKVYLDCTKLGHALQSVKLSLEILVIDIVFLSSTAFQDHRLSDWGTTGDLGLLNNYAKLKTLDVPLMVLLGWAPHPEVRLASVLPSGLHHLRCTNYMAGLGDWKWTDEAVMAQFQDYLTIATDLKLWESWAGRKIP